MCLRILRNLDDAEKIVATEISTVSSQLHSAVGLRVDELLESLRWMTPN